VRITVGDHAYRCVLWPKLKPLLRAGPDIRLDIVLDSALTDIAAQRFDAGARLGEQVAKDMIAVRIGPDIRFAVVGAKSYFKGRRPPATPQELTGTPASTCASPPTAGCGPGTSSATGAS
jgi:DNA-binding transcriptional LysR family regulator